MKLIIFGATGGIGRHLVRQALEQGHAVIAFVRDPTKLGISYENLEVVQGDVLDLPSVEEAVQAQDAVLCSLGAGAKGKVRSKGTQNIIWAMEKAGVRRFICQSSLGVGVGVGDSWKNLTFFWKYIMFSGLLRQAGSGGQRSSKWSRLDYCPSRGFHGWGSDR